MSDDTRPVGHNEPDAERRLRDCPAWIYLLTEFQEIYGRGSAGGSKAIRAHRRKVRATLSLVTDANPVIAPREPMAKPVVAHLPRAFDLAGRGSMAGLGRALERAATELTWEYGYKRVPPHLAEKYAYCEILGPRGPVV